MPIASVNGIDLAYLEQGHGQPVVFVHGGSGDYRVWDQQLPGFATSYRAIAPSCRGYWPNAALRPGEPVALQTHVDDLAHLLRALDAGPVHLVGHSSPGGFGSLLLAAQKPELLRTLVLLEPPAFPLLGVNIPPRPLDLVKLLIRHPHAGIAFITFGAKGVRPAMKAFERGDDAEGLRIFMGANVNTAAVDQMPAPVFDQFLANVGPLKAQLAAGFPTFTPHDASTIEVPTLLVSGADSPAHLQAVTQRLATLIPDAERLTIPGASHNMFNSHPAEFNTGVLEFLQRHGDSR